MQNSKGVSPRRFMIAVSDHHHPVVFEYFNRIASRLAAHGHKVVFLLESSPHPPPSGSSGKEYVRWPHVWTDWRNSLFFARLLLKHRPGTLVSNYGASNLRTLAIAWALRVPVRVVWVRSLARCGEMVTPSRTAFDRKMRLFKMGTVYRLATKLVSISEAVRRDVISQWGVPSSKITVKHNRVFDPADMGAVICERTSAPVTVACVAGLYPTKGLDVLLRAASLLAARFPSFRLELIGPGPLRRDLEKLTAELGLTDRCIFRGWLSYPRTLEALSAAHIAVLPALTDGCSMVLMEAFALGIPVVASAVDGIPEIVEDGVNGLLCPPGEPGALAAAMARLLEDEDLRRRLGQGARESFDRSWNWAPQLEAETRWMSGLAGTAP